MLRNVPAELIEPTPFTFTYTLRDAGWASAIWETEGRTFRFSLSYLGNPLGDLLQVLNELEQCYDGSVAADEQNSFDWQGEPQRYGFVFIPLDGRNVRLTITYQTDGFVAMTPKETWLETVVSLDELQQQAFTHAEAILRDFGLSGYRLSWIDGDFPISEFLKLRSSLLGTSLPRNSLAAEVEYFTSLVTDRRQQEAALERQVAQRYCYAGEGLSEYLVAHLGLSAFLLEVAPAVEAVFGASVAAALSLALHADLSSEATRLEVIGQTALDRAGIRKARNEFRRQWWNKNAYRADQTIHFRFIPAPNEGTQQAKGGTHEAL